MRGIVQIIAAGCLLAGLHGCGHSRNWDGHWTGVRPFRIKPKQNPTIAYTAAKVDFKSKGGRFDLFDGGLATPMSGLVDARGDEASLEVKEIMGQPIEQQSPEVIRRLKDISITQNRDGSLTYRCPESFGGTPLVLKRGAQP